MSHNDSIRNLLNIKDKNIIFDNNFYSEGKVKDIQSKIFHATLTYQPKACYACGHVFDGQIIKHGFLKQPSLKYLVFRAFILI